MTIALGLKIALIAFGVLALTKYLLSKKPPKPATCYRSFSTYIHSDGTFTAHIMNRVTEKFIALPIESGKWGIHKVLKKEYYHSFGCACTSVDLKFTGYEDNFMTSIYY